LLWNGNKAGAIKLAEEARVFFERDLKLELSESKTRVTHVDDGFTFLGFDIRRYNGTHGKPIVLIHPSQKNVRKLKAKIKALTRRDTTYQPVWYKVTQLNQILRGWSAYYQHVNAKTAFHKLDWWALNRIFGWARKKHGRPPWRVIRAKYRHRDPKGRINFVYRLQDGSSIWLYRMSDRPIRRYWVNWNRPTYAEKGISTDVEDHSDILIEPVSYPAKEGNQVRLMVLRRDRYTCQRCRATRTNLRVHHIVSKKNGGSDDPDNLITLCHQCHCKMHKSCNDDSAVPTVNADGKPCAGKLARTVWEAA
jgi:RNA-directed DNA polymerase